MKTKMILLMCCLGLVLTSKSVIAEITTLPDGPIVYRDYQADDLVQIVEKLNQSHRHSETVEAGEEALYRDLTPDQDALVRYKMAQSYEFIEDGGSLAREKYGEVLELHPDYERAAEVALRLGQLNNSVILAGTERNPARAIECYEYILNKYEDANSAIQNVYYIVMKAHMGLGNLRWYLKDYAKAKEHFESIYKCDIEMVEPLPHEVFEKPEELAEYRNWLRKRVTDMKDKIPAKLVGLCIRPESETSVAELEKLTQEYSSDSAVLDIANEKLRQVWEQIGNVDSLIDDAADGSIQPADDFDEK